MSAPVPQDLDVFACPLDGIRLIEASAGTGKTWNICGLYLRLLLERGLEVQQVLVVTFTRAATAELKTRIRERIVATLAYLDGGASGPDPFVPDLVAALEAHGLDRAGIRARLEPALQAFDEAAIFTIHGWCQRALADTPFAAGLPFALELEEDDLELRLEATRDFWRRHVAADSCPAELGELLAAEGDSPETWAELLRARLARPMAEVRWPDAVPEGEGEAELAALAAAFEHARTLWRTDGTAATRAVLDGCPNLKANIYKPEGIALAARSWTAWLAGGEALAAIDLKEGKHELLSATKLVDGTKKGCTTPTHPFFDAAAELLRLHAQVLSRLAAARLALIRRFLEETTAELRRLKRERRRIAFDDILSNVHQALAGGERPWLAGALHGRYPAALIDEFQDTDPLQFDLFRRIYADGGRRGSLFLVGDPKQAIYSFRNADLFTYLDARSHADAHYTLRHNQRSSGALIAACNALFGANPQAFVLPGLDYVAVEEGAKPRAPFRDDTESAGPAALRVWRIAPGPEGLPLRAEAMRRAATATAAEIARLVAEGATGRIAIGERPLMPGDIAVLVKSHAQGARMREALAALGVASVELSQASIFHSVDAEELERVLLAVAEPARQPLVLAALATAAMGRDAAALDALAADEDALLAVIDRFAALRETWLARGFGVMLRQWIAQEGVSARLLAREDGERRLTNLLHLAECLHEAARSLPAPDALLRWFAGRRREGGSGEAAQLRLESDRNLVQIVTIHRAKGLEYGVVFCPFLFDGNAGRSDSGAALSYHDEGAGARPVLDFRPESREDTTIRANMRRERDAELLRLVYVALTRAVHRCYLVAGCYQQKAGGRLATTESERSLLNWLVAGAGMGHAEWREHRLGEAAIDAAWAAICARAAPHLAIADLPDGTGRPIALPAGEPAALAARTPPARLPAAWHIGSFSALSHAVAEARDTLAEERSARDHDARVLPPPLRTEPPALAPDDILLFPRGALAGDCIHAVFERIDFTDPRGWDEAIRAALAEHPQRADALATPAQQARMLRRMVEAVLATELPEGVVLGRVPPARRLVELGFHLPAPSLDPAALNDWLAAHGYPVPRLGFAPLAGYLKGFIDLVFEHDGRFYLLDWKSNHLGADAADYGPTQVEAAMAAHGYHLQHLLYTVALHRHLGRTLPGYDYARHFGGSLYLFVRGVRPGWQADGAPAGVYFHRPPAATLASLDALLAAPPARSRRRK